MPPKVNPLRLNNLQRKTLAVLQALAADPRASTPLPETGEILITEFPIAIHLTASGLSYTRA